MALEAVTITVGGRVWAILAGGGSNWGLRTGGSGRRWAWVRLAVVAAAVAFAGVKSQSLWPRLASAPARAAGPARSPAEGAVLRPIEQVRLGNRVPGENPSEEPDARFGAEVEPASWRRVDLSCRKRDGTAAAVSLLRPLWWLEAQEARVGGTLTIAVPECGIDGDADVLAIGPCPPVRPGRGSVVTGTFRYANAAVIDLHVAGLDGPVGTTPNHKFWSGERGAFVRADALGWAHEARAGGHTVYNLETYPHHVYRVSAAALLVHNADPAVSTCYTVQSAADAVRLREGGVPWPTLDSRSHLGEGVYSWSSRGEAEAYQSLLLKRHGDAAQTEIVPFKVADADLAKMSHTDVDKLPNPDEFMDKHSKTRGGTPKHGVEYAKRGTSMGDEHFFDKSVMDKLKFCPK